MKTPCQNDLDPSRRFDRTPTLDSRIQSTDIRSTDRVKGATASLILHSLA